LTSSSKKHKKQKSSKTTTKKSTGSDIGQEIRGVFVDPEFSKHLIENIQIKLAGCYYEV